MSHITYLQDGVVKKTSSTFFRGEVVNFHPSDHSLEQPDFISEYLTQGWMPGRGFVTKDTPVVAFGSCFAANIANYLDERGYNILTRKASRAYVTSMGDGIVHTFAIRQQFEWAWEGKVPTQDLWHGYKAEEFGYSEEARADTEALFNRAEMFIITLGLSEIWYDEPTGEVFWRAVPSDRIDLTRHKFRVATHAETLDNLRAIHRLIRTHRPGAEVLFTLSPVPLTATFRPVACVSANAVSKAILRSALDEFLRQTPDPKLHYFPSYEIVLTAFNHQWKSDRKHVYAHVLDFNMKVFEHYYCAPGIPLQELKDSFADAQRLDRILARIGHDDFATLNVTDEEIREQRRRARIEKRIAERKAARLEARAG